MFFFDKDVKGYFVDNSKIKFNKISDTIVFLEENFTIEFLVKGKTITVKKTNKILESANELYSKALPVPMVPKTFRTDVMYLHQTEL